MGVKFLVTGTISVEITAEVFADNEADAKDIIDSADVSIESCDSSITFTDCSQSGSEVDDVKCPAADKWEELDPLERAIILKDNGVSNEAAYEIATRDYLIEIDEEWWEYFNE